MTGKPRGASPYDLNEWARLQTRKHKLAAREAHLLLVLAGYADRHTLKCYPSVASLARDCGLKLSTYTFDATDRGGETQRTVSRNSTISAALKRLHDLDLIRICPRGQGLTNYYYVHFEKPSRADLVAHGMRRLEYEGPDSTPVLEYDQPYPKEYDQPDTNLPVGNPPVEITGQPEPDRARSTTGRTPESTPCRTPQDNGEPDITPERVRALIEASPLGKRINGIEEAAA